MACRASEQGLGQTSGEWIERSQRSTATGRQAREKLCADKKKTCMHDPLVGWLQLAPACLDGLEQEDE